VRVAGRPHLGGGRHRHDLAEKMVDPLPVLVLGDDAGRGWQCRLVGASPAEGGVARAAAPALARGAEESLLESVLQRGRDIFRRFEVV